MLGLGDALFLLYSGYCVEVVDPVGDLDQKGLAVHLALQLGVRKHVLLRLCQGVIGGVKVFVTQSCHRVYDVRDARIELLLDVFERNVAIFDYVMEQCRHDHIALSPPFSYRTRCAKHVIDIRLA